MSDLTDRCIQAMIAASLEAEHSTAAEQRALEVLMRYGGEALDARAFGIGFQAGARWMEGLADKILTDTLDEFTNARQSIQNPNREGQRHLDPVRDLAGPGADGGPRSARALPTGLPDVVRDAVPGEGQA